jgi:CysZ protein
MPDNPLSGAAYLLRGFSLITLPGVRRFVAVPLAINTLLFGLATWYAASRFAAAMHRVLPTWLDWLQWLLWPLFLLMFLVIVYFTFSIIANLIAAPFNGYLAAAVERALTGTAPEPDITFAQEFVRTLRSELHKMGYAAMLAVPLFVLMLIPGPNVLATPLWVLFSAWMQSLQNLDFPMGNHGIVFREQREVHRTHRMLSIGFGAAVTVTLLVPVLNFFAIPAAVAGGTALWVERMRGPGMN